MELSGILTAIGVNGLLTAGIAWLQNRQINRATARATEQNSAATYTQTVIEQANARVDQAISDSDRYIKERDEAWAEMKSQRKDKRKYRTQYHDEERAHHATQLALKDERYFRCVLDCPKRKPPRIEPPKPIE